MSTIHVRAVGDLRVPIVGTAGRFAGRARKTHEPLPEGEQLPDHVDYRRALARGELALVEPAAPKSQAARPSAVSKEGDR